MSFLTWLLLLFRATWLVAPEEVVRQLHAETPAALSSMERTATVVAKADPLTSPIRWILRHLPVRDRAAAVLARAHAEAAGPLGRARAALGPPLPQRARPSGVEAAVESMTAALTRSLAASVGVPTTDAASGRDREGRPDSDEWRQIDRTLEILKETRVQITGLAVWQLLYLLAELGLAVGFLTLALRARRPRPSGKLQRVEPTPLVRRPSRISRAAAALEARLHPDLGPIGRFLRHRGLPQTLAFEIDRCFRRHAKWPGSLKGHDAVSGGLQRHCLAVGRLMAKMARAHGRETQRAAAFLGIVHDLGKTLTYQPAGSGWTGHPATPHDSLSARILGQLEPFRHAFPDPVRRAILQALRDYHSPETFASNASPLAKQLLAWLLEADTEVIQTAAPAAKAEAG